MKAICQHRFWGKAIKCLILAGTLAAAVTIVSPRSLEADSSTLPPWLQQIRDEFVGHNNTLVTHDANQAQQHLSLSGALSAHNSAQTSQYNTLSQEHQSLSGGGTVHDGAQTSQHHDLSQQIANLSTGGDQSGLPPTWDKTLAANDTGDPCNSTRFKCVMGGASVRDNETGLVWERSIDVTTQTWVSALGRCANLNTGGRKGWRLPSFAELSSLVDPSVAPPAPRLPAGHPFTNVQSFYWSATTLASNPPFAWFVYFGSGDVDSSDKVFSFSVWCVRGGMNADAY